MYLLIIITLILFIVNFYFYIKKSKKQINNLANKNGTIYCDNSNLFMYKNIFFENYLQPYPFKPGKYDPSYNLLTEIARKNMNNNIYA